MKVRVESASRSELMMTFGNLSLEPNQRRLLDRCLMETTSYWVAEIDDALVCVWGLIPPTLLSTSAYIWLYNTDLVDRHPFIFIRYSQRLMEEMLKQYDTIFGHAVVGNNSGMKWLQWLGATFSEPHGGLMPFQIRAKHG